MTDDPLIWRIEGTYFESCNCDVICPCRRIDGKPGGRSTYGECLFALSWLVTDGHAGDVDLSGLAVVLTGRYHDDEPGSPWTLKLHVDERGSDEQRLMLSEILLGRLGGDHILQLPWVAKPSDLIGIRPSRIEIDHTPSRQWFRIGATVTVRVARAADTAETVTCGIPGHSQSGEELFAETLKVNDGPLDFEFSGNCAYSSGFSYRSHPV